jgi:hypothetical protein
MRFSTVAACLAACLAPAAALSIFDGNAPDLVANDDLDIPGDSPLQLCPGDHSKDLVEIERVDLSPNPPKAYGRTASVLHCLSLLTLKQ